MTTLFEVIADPTRRQLLNLLRVRPRTVGELVENIGISQPGISKHLRILRDAGLVNVRQDAQRRWYELDPRPLQELDHWLSGYRSLWESRLDRLDEYLRELQQQERQDGERE